MSGNRPALTCALAVLLFSSSGGSADVHAQPASIELEIDACALLEPEEIANLVGAQVEAGKRTDSGLESNGAYSSTCLWVMHLDEGALTASSASMRGKSFVILNAFQWPVGSGRAGSFLDDFRKAAADGELPSQPEPRSVGDEALWWGDGLAVRRADVSFGLSIFGPLLKSRSPQRAGEWEEALAPYILRRLDQTAARSR